MKFLASDVIQLLAQEAKKSWPQRRMPPSYNPAGANDAARQFFMTMSTPMCDIGKMDMVWDSRPLL